MLGVDAAGAGTLAAAAAGFTTVSRPRGGAAADALLFAPAGRASHLDFASSSSAFDASFVS